LIDYWRLAQDFPRETARWVDGKQHLQERLSTALEMAKGKGTGAEAWRELLVTDAASHLKEVDPRRLVSISPAQDQPLGVAGAGLGAGLGFVPEYRSKNYLQKQADQTLSKKPAGSLWTSPNAACNVRLRWKTQKAMDAVNELGEQFHQEGALPAANIEGPGQLTDRLRTK